MKSYEHTTIIFGYIYPNDGAIVSFKPAKMLQEDYDKYTHILKNWLTENGFM
jgi:hypothetical protein